MFRQSCTPQLISLPILAQNAPDNPHEAEASVIQRRACVWAHCLPESRPARGSVTGQGASQLRENRCPLKTTGLSEFAVSRPMVQMSPAILTQLLGAKLMVVCLTAKCKRNHHREQSSFDAPRTQANAKALCFQPHHTRTSSIGATATMFLSVAAQSQSHAKQPQRL